MEKNKTGKYLKYAIGEIILVMIGILLALQVNNWNEQRKAHADFKSYLSEILKDLETDVNLFKAGVEKINDNIQLEEWVLNKTDYKSSQVDSLWDSFGSWYYDYRINDRTFQKIKSTAGSRLIGFEHMYNQLTNYYVVLKDQADLHAEWDKKEVTERQNYMKDLEAKIEISNYRLSNLSLGVIDPKFPKIQDSAEQTTLVIDFANSIRGRNHFKNNYFRHARLAKKYNEVVRQATSLIAEIQQELDN
jgi:uncharacterized membrane protein YgaE (UPF0421/DUF939 family)